MRLIEEQGVFSLFTRTREINLFCILEYMFASILNISFTLTATIVPIVLILTMGEIIFMGWVLFKGAKLPATRKNK